MDVADYVATLGERSRAAARVMARAATADKNRALLAIRSLVEVRRELLLEANASDVRAAVASALDAALVDRLRLTPERIDAMLVSLTQIADLPDLVGAIDHLRVQPSGISVGQMRVPLGVIGIIYEARPNVTIEAASLCLKSGNACILRGGSEALASNAALAACIADGLVEAGLPAAAVQSVDTPDRAVVGALLADRGMLDVIIPRGGRGLIERVAREARVPVLKHLDGVCHVYVDAAADTAMAVSIVTNAKTHRYGTCNAAETLLVAAARAQEMLPLLAAPLWAAGVELRGCEVTRAILGPDVLPATEADWSAEYLAPILAIRVVAGVDAAMAHIARYGSSHTDAIVSNDHATAMRFLREVDSASVLINASTRFADGFEYGLGAEIGISTDRLHARGPVGLEGLTTRKYVVLGSGQVRR